MKEFQGKVAVVTGGASGIGRALAEHAAQLGMKIVLADIEEGALQQARQALEAGSAQVLAVKTDVSKAEEVEALAHKTLEHFGAVHLLFNNAGVGAGATIWDSTLADWQWVLGVNLWGVIHGVHTFVPLMLKQGVEAHIVNTASIAGLISGPGLGIYKVTKFGVVTLSETLYSELTLTGAPIKVSVLCPGWVKTRVMESERNRPAALQNAAQEPLNPAGEAILQMVHQAVETGMAPSQVAEAVFQAIREEKFYILTHPHFKAAVESRNEDIHLERNPTFTPFM
ncbi:MAG TPA: SDR family NAD(P)-dependent oxidoreductase [Ktedonobacterales bacterium]